METKKLYKNILTFRHWLLNLSWLSIPLALFLTACNLKLQPEVNSSKSSSQASLVTKQSLDRIVASKRITGRLIKFIWNDYLYAIIKTDEGEKIFFVDHNENCFLAQNKAFKLSIQYDVVERYIPQASGYHSVNIIRAITTTQTDWQTWQRSITPRELEQCRKNADKF